MSNTALVTGATGKTSRNTEADVSTTVLVTGPTGKAGRRLVPLLARWGMTVRTASWSRYRSARASPPAEPRLTVIIGQ